MATTYDHDVFLAVLENLTLAAQAGTLTEAELSRHMSLTYDDGDYIDRSFGAQWIIKHPALFAKVVKSPLAFLRQHLKVAYAGELFILYPEILKLVAQTERVAYLRDTLLACGARNNGWVKVAQSVGVTTSELSQIILAKLRATPADRDLKYSNICTYVHSFMEYGAGRQWRLPSADHTPEDWQKCFERGDGEWYVMDVESFAEAAKICADKSPANFMQYRRRLEARLRPELMQSLLTIVLREVNNFERYDPADLKDLSLFLRLEVGRRLQMLSEHATYAQVRLAQFLVGLIVEMPDDAAARAYFEEIKPLLKKLNAALLYRTTHSIRQQPSSKKWLESELRRLVIQAGYYFGTIEEYRRTDPRTKYVTLEKQVRYAGAVYVQSRGSHRYFPRTGDQVMFNPRHGHELRASNPRVVAVYFSHVKDESIDR